MITALLLAMSLITLFGDCQLVLLGVIVSVRRRVLLYNRPKNIGNKA